MNSAEVFHAREDLLAMALHILLTSHDTIYCMYISCSYCQQTTFEHNNFPDPIDQHCIALRIKTPYRSIKMWFQNRRASVRKRLHPEEKG